MPLPPGECFRHGAESRGRPRGSLPRLVGKPALRLETVTKIAAACGVTLRFRAAGFHELNAMPLTRDFKETVHARAQRDPAFRDGLLKEGFECLLAGDVDAGKIVLRDYIEATIGFEALGSLRGQA